eukprot:GHVU01045748.1.p1 GENE.GHVU01045748.1~~GHVU01045748.1.p1  ORF type:complete len:236 (-),score=14.11 GHVU01045748.1:52-759(-)
MSIQSSSTTASSSGDSPNSKRGSCSISSAGRDEVSKRPSHTRNYVSVAAAVQPRVGLYFRKCATKDARRERQIGEFQTQVRAYNGTFTLLLGSNPKVKPKDYVFLEEDTISIDVFRGYVGESLILPRLLSFLPRLLLLSRADDCTCVFDIPIGLSYVYSQNEYVELWKRAHLMKPPSQSPSDAPTMDELAEQLEKMRLKTSALTSRVNAFEKYYSSIRNAHTVAVKAIPESESEE